MEKTPTGIQRLEHKPNLQRVTKNINNWINVLSDDVKMHRHESKLTLRMTFTGMSINEMIRFHGAKRSDIMAIVDLQLTRFIKSINVTNTLTDFQKQELVMHLVENYPHETLNDFVLMFKRVRHGYYGPIYNRIDITVISEYMSKYLEAKAYERENIEREVHSEMLAMEKFQTRDQFKNAEEYDEYVKQYNEWKQSWYNKNLTLREKLIAVEKKFNRMEKMGVPADKEKSFIDFKNQYIKEKKNDVSSRGTMDGNDGGGANGNVPVSDGKGSDGIEPIQRTGSEHHEQNQNV
jgi:hypothetical protein